MRIVDRDHSMKAVALVRNAGGWYAMAVGTMLLRCTRCRRQFACLCSPAADAPLSCADCFPFVQRELDRASSSSMLKDMAGDAKAIGTARTGERIGKSLQEPVA
jgi:DTW domain-containing protein YfiP